MQDRIEQYDRARGILILLVVIGHLLIAANPDWSNRFYALGNSFITSFHMPAFFLLSGMLSGMGKTRKRSWSALLARRARALLIPYLFFEILSIAYQCAVLGTLTLKNGLIRMVTLQCNTGADWFLPAAFFSGVLFFAYVKYIQPLQYGCIIGAFLAAASLCAAWLIPHGIILNTCIRGLLGFGFMFVGDLLRPLLVRHTPKRDAAAAVLTVFFAALSYFFASNDFYTCIVNNPFLFLCSGLSGFYLVLGVSNILNWKILSWLGQNSLVIMGTHQLVLYTVPHSSSILWILGVFVLILLIEVIIVLLFNRICPFLIGKSRREC